MANHTEFGMNVYGLMTVGGIPKPGWRSFQLLHEHAGDRRYKTNVTEHAGALASEQCVVDPQTAFKGFEVQRIRGCAGPEACCAACKSDKRCTFWTFDGPSKACSLQNSDAGRTADPAATSGSSLSPPVPTRGAP